jgi:hypothetical protein
VERLRCPRKHPPILGRYQRFLKSDGGRNGGPKGPLLTCAYSARKTGTHPRIKSDGMLLQNTRWST